MRQFQPRDPDYVDRVAAAFRDGSTASQWGGELTSVSPGGAEIALAFRDDASGGPGMLHRSIVAGLLDDACLLAALTLASPGDQVHTIEYKVNFLAPATGEQVVVRAEVLRPGRTITVCRAEANCGDTPVARMLATYSVSRPG